MMTAESTHADPEELLALKSRRLMPCTYHFFQRPPHIVRGDGALLFDHAGGAYIDCLAGVGVMNAGHANPAIIEPAIEQIRTLQHVSSIFLTEPVLRLAERLAPIVPVHDPRFFFCASGSEAVEFAMLTATQATGRPLIIAARDGLHGRTRWAMSATGLSMWRSDPIPMDDRFVHVPFDDVRAVRDALAAHPRQVAAVIAEPVLGNGGIRVPGPSYWPGLRAACDEHGAHLIADEVQTGFHRTGRWFACEHWNVRPDIVCMSKGLGNGFPIAAIAVRGTIARERTRPSASTHGGNPVSAAAALATIDEHVRCDLGRAADERGRQLASGLDRLAAAYPGLLSKSHGLGLMRGVTVYGVPAFPASACCDALLETLKDGGVLAGKTGRDRNVLTFMPPLVISSEQVDHVLDVLDESAARVIDSR
jgi:acetylornithine/succinyldiaminopimelate/putrescine aminotransferase